MSHLLDIVNNGLAAIEARFSVDAHWLMENSQWVSGSESAADLQQTLRHYSLSGVASEIDYPTLVMVGEEDYLVPCGLAQEFVDELMCPTTLRVFRTEEGTGEHC